MWKSIITAVLLVVLVGTVSGCSKTTGSSGKVVHLRFSVLGAKQETDLANALARSFEKSHPNIRVDVEPVAGMGYDTKLVMQSAANTLPDVMFLADSLVPTFTQFKVVKDLTDIIESDRSFNKEDIYPQMLATGMDKRGRIYMLPRELGVVILFYNRTLFKRAGLPDPSPDWDYDDFLAAAKKLTLRDKNGRVTQYGFTASYNWAGFYASWVAGAGGSVISKDGKKSTLSTPESLKAFKLLTDLVTLHKVAMPPSQTLTAPGVDPFAAGKIAMQPQVFPQVPLYRVTMKQFDWDVQVLPAGPAKRVCNMGAAGYGISSGTKHPKEAWEFLKYIVSPEGQRILGKSGSGIPTLKSLAHDPCWRKPGMPPKNLDAFINSVQYGMGWQDILPFTKAEVVDTVSLAFDDVFTGQATVEESFKRADAKINRIFARERGKQ